MHNRLTHSEKVAQVARSIAERLISSKDNHTGMALLGGFDVDVCVAAALAHDLGHPPFGHIGEEVLDELALTQFGLDGFEGNAQSVRILTIGKARSPKYEGLDVTNATLAAVAKYPWVRIEQKRDAAHKAALKDDAAYRRYWRKFNFYETEAGRLGKCREFATAIPEKTQTLEASVMDVADDITYAIHDLEDFYIGGILNISHVREDLDAFTSSGPDAGVTAKTIFHQLSERLAIDYPGWFNSEALVEAAQVVDSRLKYGFSRRNPEVPAVQADARATGSRLVGEYTDSVLLSDRPLWEGGPYIGLPQSRWHEVQIYKEITRSYIIQRPDIALLQRGQQTALRNLTLMLSDWAKTDKERLPPRLREEIGIVDDLESGTLREGYGSAQAAPRGPYGRVILDYICSLTDAQCLGLYSRLSGHSVHRIALTGTF